MFALLSSYFYQIDFFFFVYRLHNLVTSRQQDKQNISILERKLQDACKNKCVVEQQLASERKAKKAEESAAARAVLMAAAR